MREKIKKIIGDTFDLAEVPDDISQKTCVGWDSMRHLQLIVELETEFEISLEPEDITEMLSLDEIENKIKIKMN